MLAITKHQMEHLGSAVRRRFETRAVLLLTVHFPEAVSHIDLRDLLDAVSRCIALGSSYGIESERDVARLILLSFALRLDPNQNVLQPWMLATLTDDAMPPRARLQRIFDRVVQSWSPALPDAGAEVLRALRK